MDIKFVEVQTNSTDGVIALFDLVFTVTSGSDSGRIVFVSVKEKLCYGVCLKAYDFLFHW